MRRSLGILVAALIATLVVPAVAGDKNKDKDKDKKKEAPKEAVAHSNAIADAEKKLAAGDRAGAVRLLQEAAGAPGASGELTLRLGQMLESNYEIDAALEAYKAAAEKLTGPAKGEALARLALVQEIRALGDPVKTAEQAAEADAAGAWPKVALARARVGQKKLDEAQALLESQTGPAAQAARGYLQEGQGDYAAAEATYRQVLAAEAGRADATIGLARVLRKTGRAAEAETALQELLAVMPGAVEAYKESARVKVARGRLQDAAGDAAIAASLADGDAETKHFAQDIVVLKALADARKGEADFAIQDLKTLLTQDAESPILHAGLARVYTAKRDAASAGAEIEKALALDPESPDAHFALGYLNHVVKGSAATALPELEKAVAGDPENTEYRTHLGAVLSELQLLDRAQEELTRVTSMPGYDKPEGFIYLGGAYLSAKKYKESVAALEKALALAPEVQMTNAYMAWAQFALKDVESFKKYGAKARALGYKDARFLDNLTKVEGGAPIK